MDWTEERIEELKRRHAAGETFSTIGAAMGVSRNAAIGKAQRLGLAPRAMGPKKGSKKRRVPGGFLRIKPRPESIQPPMTIAEPLEPDITRACGLLDLQAGQCKWPLGAWNAPPTTFCGNDRPDGQPYCHFHARIAYQPLPRRKPNGPQAQA